jgi:hypothetical protein
VVFPLEEDTKLFLPLEGGGEVGVKIKIFRNKKNILKTEF